MTNIDIDSLVGVPRPWEMPHLNDERVLEYSQRLDELQPVVVFRTAEGPLLSDGYHRVAAARLIGRGTIEADIRIGTPDDALAYAAEANGLSIDDILPVVGPDVPTEAEYRDVKQLFDAAKASVTIRHVRAIVDLLGPGKPLTQKGNLKLADARALAWAIGRAREFDMPEGFKTYTSREVPSVDLTFWWAKAAKFIRVQKNVAYRTPRGKRVGKDPISDVVVLFDAFVKRMNWTARRYTARGNPYYAKDMWRHLPNLLGLAMTKERLDLTFIAGDFAMWLTREYDFDNATPAELDNLPWLVQANLWQTVFCPLGELGIFSLTGYSPPMMDSRVRDEEQTAALTPIGRACVSRFFEEHR